MSTQLSVEELRVELKNGKRPQMIDVRTPSEFAGGHIPCATNIPMDQFEARKKDLRLEDGVVLICKGGTRAQIVAGWMNDQPKVQVLAGGTDAWIKSGQEVVTSARTRWSLERQVRLVAGLLVLVGTLLAASGVHGGIWLAMFIGAGLTFAGATDICGMGILLAKMPWNQARAAGGGTTSNPYCG
jgi:rhodanese-related sulfurtransferase